MITRSGAGLALFAFAAILLSAVPAPALDGEVLINQAKAGAGGISPGDTAGYPITISESGKYKLAGNLLVPPDKNGFAVTADNVTIDLNGFRIAGGIIAINAPNVDGLTVMNGIIKGGSSDGIRARGFTIVQDMQVADRGGMGVRLDNNGRVIRSTMSGNHGVNVYCVSRCLIAGNVVSGSETESGIGLFTNAGGHLVLGNVISNNTLFAIYSEGPTGYANNTITGNGEFGGSSVVGSATQAHPNYCNPACP